MNANQICGEIFTKDRAEHFLGLTTSLLKTIIKALASDSNIDWSSQKASMWVINTSRHPDPLDQAIADAKGNMVSNHVSFYEEFKAIKYGEYTYNWPQSLYQHSLWAKFWQAMAEDRPIYQLRNWFSHELGRRTTTLMHEKERFETLLQAYRNFLPALEELVAKLEAAVEDDNAWAEWGVAQARKSDPDRPVYTLDCEAVLLHKKQKEKERDKRWEEEKRLYLARLARIEEEKENPWGCEEWVHVKDVVGEEWDQGTEKTLSTGEVGADLGCVWGTQDNTPEDGGEQRCDKVGEDLPASTSAVAFGWDNAPSHLGYEDDVADRVIRLYCTCAFIVAVVARVQLEDHVQ